MRCPRLTAEAACDVTGSSRDGERHGIVTSHHLVPSVELIRLDVVESLIDLRYSSPHARSAAAPHYTKDAAHSAGFEALSSACVCRSPDTVLLRFEAGARSSVVSGQSRRT